MGRGRKEPAKAPSTAATATAAVRGKGLPPSPSMARRFTRRLLGGVAVVASASFEFGQQVGGDLLGLG